MGGGFGLLLPLLFSLVFAQTNYCPSTLFPGASTCSSFGSGHIHTFDGVAYDFHEYGEFILFRSADDLILSRQTDCDTSYTIGVPITDTTSYSATCNRAFLFEDLNSGDTWEFRHDINNNTLTFVEDGTVLNPPALPTGLTGLQVSPIQYVNPYKTMQRDSKQFMRDADFSVSFVVPSGSVVVNIIFYATGRATIQLTLPNRIVADGLCGYVDGCPANDLYLRSDSYFNPPVSSNAQIVTVDATVRAGSLPDGSQFIQPSTVNNPGQWASRFAATWRVANQESRINSINLFQHPTGNNYNIRKLTSSYPGAKGSCPWASGMNIPQFITDQCKLDIQLGNDPDGFDALYTYHVFLFDCTTYCNTGAFANRNPQLQSSQCNAFCQYPQGDLTQDLHSNWSSSPLPPNLFQNSDESGALFTSTLNLGGTYTFHLNTTDYCESRVFNLTRTIRCQNSLSLNSASMTPSTWVKRNHWFGYPALWILSTPPSKGLVRASWKVIDAPAGANSLSYARSFTPLLNAQVAGTYVLELAVYDGCQIKKQNVTVVLQCSSCPTASIVGVAHLKEVLWNLNLDTAQTGYVLSVPQSNLVYPQKTLTSASQTQNWPTSGALNYDWSFVSDDDTSDLLFRTTLPTAGTQTFEQRVYANSSLASFALLNPTGGFVNYSETTWNTTVSMNSSAPVTSLKSTRLQGPINTTYGVLPPQREFNITRDGFSMSNSTVTTMRKTNTTVMQTAFYTVNCTFQITTSKAATATLTTTPTNSYTLNRGMQCEGQYNLQLNVSETNCKFSTDTQKVDVNCGLAPEVFVACPVSVPFNYNTQSFPLVTIDASRSVDVFGRALYYLYSFVTDPSNSSIVLSNNCQNGCTQNTATFTPSASAPGTYQISVEVSNYCNSNKQTASVTTYCPQTNPADFQSSITAPVTTLIYDAANLYSKQLGLTAVTNTSGGLAGVVFSNRWRILYISNASVIPPASVLAPAQIAPATGATTTVTFGVDGDYKIELLAGVGCNQTINNTVVLTYTCGATFTSFTLSPSTQQVYWDINKVGGAGFPQVPFTYTFLMNNQGQTPVSYWFLNNTLQTTAALTFPLNHVGGPATDMVGLWLSDGCRTTYASANITWLCYPMTAVLTASATTMFSGETVTLDGTMSNVSNIQTSPSLAWDWILVSGPTDNPNPTKYTLITLNQTQVNFTATWAGSYTFVLRVRDGCSTSPNSTAVTIVVSCSRPLTTAAATSTPTPTFWDMNAFPVINLNSNGSPKNYSTDPLYAYQWRMLSAPTGSVFNPTFTSYSYTVFNGNNSLPNNVSGGYNYMWTQGDIVQYKIDTNTYIYLNPNVADRNTTFPACFTPDLAGDYTVELWAQDMCQQQRTTITVQANCPLRPLPDLNVTEVVGYNATANGHYVTKNTAVAQPNTWSVSLSRTAPRRVVLDARGSKGYSSSKLTYYWAWNAPDPRAGTGRAQEGIETPYASTSAVLLSNVGTYYLSLYVHDGCGYQFLNFTLVATCGGGSLLSTSLVQQASINTNGQPLYTWALMFSDDQNECAKSNNWTFVNFTSTPGNAGSTVRSSMATLVVALIASLFFTQF